MQEIALDLIPNNAYVVVSVKQGDSGRGVNATIYRNGVREILTSNYQASYRIRKPDATSIWNSASIITNPEGGYVSFEFTTQSLIAAGRAYGDIRIVDQSTGQSIGTASFVIIIAPAPEIIKDLTSSSEFEQVENILTEADIIINEAQAWAEGKYGTRDLVNDSTSELTEQGTTNIVDYFVPATFRAQEAVVKTAQAGATVIYNFVYNIQDAVWTFKYSYDGSTWTTGSATYAESGLNLFGIFLKREWQAINGHTLAITATYADPQYDNFAKYWTKESEKWATGEKDHSPIVDDVISYVASRPEITFDLYVPFFKKKVGFEKGRTDIYVFSYNSSTEQWELDGTTVNLDEYGIHLTVLPNVPDFGDTITVSATWGEDQSNLNSKSWAEVSLEGADRIENLTVSAYSVDPISLYVPGEATVTKTFNPDGAVNLRFGVPRGLKGNVNFAVFNIDPVSGNLIMSWDEQYTGPQFTIDENGFLEVTI